MLYKIIYFRDMITVICISCYIVIYTSYYYYCSPAVGAPALAPRSRVARSTTWAGWTPCIGTAKKRASKIGSSMGFSLGFLRKFMGCWMRKWMKVGCKYKHMHRKIETWKHHGIWIGVKWICGESNGVCMMITWHTNGDNHGIYHQLLYADNLTFGELEAMACLVRGFTYDS